VVAIDLAKPLFTDMTGLEVRAERLSKRFLILSQRASLLRTIRAIARGETLMHPHWVLEDLSFTLRMGEHLALLGRNGSGKTTLLRLLSGILTPTSGTLEVPRPPTALFDMGVGFMRELPVLDNIYLFGAVYGMSRALLTPREETILKLAQVEHLTHSPLKDLSLGQVQRLGLSIFAQSPSQFLIFDEVLANVDRGFLRSIDRFFSQLAASNKTLIMTSHKTDFLRAYCDRGLWIEHGKVRRMGPIEEVIAEYEHASGDVRRMIPRPSGIERGA
jgi:ABC-type polysaccharide/polyol phosphate transport system ATPase subunit